MATTTQTATPEGAAADPLALLSQMAGAAPKKKGGAPVVSDPSLDPSIDAFLKAKSAYDAAESQLTTAADQLRTGAAPLRLKWCRQNKKVEASIRINGKVTLVQTCKYSAVPAEHIPTLQQAFGPDEAARYFTPKLKIEVTEEAAGDEEFLKALIKAPDRVPPLSVRLR